MTPTNRNPTTERTCCICYKRLPGEKAMHYRGNWYCRDCEELLFDDAWAEFCKRHYKRVEMRNARQ